jgi:RNA polymerase sigma-54 factor
MVGLSLSPRDQLWLGILIDSLDDDGYLRDELHEIEDSVAQLFEETFGERLDEDEQHLGLRLLQSMTPTGVGARNLQECLRLQLGELTKLRPQTASPISTALSDMTLQLTETLVSSQSLLDLLGARDFQALCKTLGCDRTALKQVIETIQSLNPKPGDGFQDNTAGIVIPDVIASAVLFSSNAVTVYRMDSSSKCRMIASSKKRRSHWTISPNFSDRRVDTIARLFGLVHKRHILHVDTIVGICLITPSATPAAFNSDVIRVAVACHQRICSLCSALLITAGLSDLKSRSAVPRS